MRCDEGTARTPISHCSTPFAVIPVGRCVHRGHAGDGRDDGDAHPDGSESTVSTSKDGPREEGSGGDYRRGETDEEGVELIEAERGDDESWENKL